MLYAQNINGNISLPPSWEHKTTNNTITFKLTECNQTMPVNGRPDLLTSDQSATAHDLDLSKSVQCLWNTLRESSRDIPRRVEQSQGHVLLCYG